MKKASSDRWSGRPSGASARRGRRAGRRFPALARSGPRPGAGIEVDDEVRPRELPVEKLVDLLVQTELIGVEVEVREDDVPGEQVVGDGPLREEIELPERALLAVALEQEEELGLERILSRVFVESPEKRILLSLLEEELRPELRGESPCKGRLADADRPLHGDVPPRRPLGRHPLPFRRDA